MKTRLRRRAPEGGCRYDIAGWVLRWSDGSAESGSMEAVLVGEEGGRGLQMGSVCTSGEALTGNG